jgi:hypothetical protein
MQMRISDSPFARSWAGRGRFHGAPGWNRTSDPQLRRLMLYPTELRAQKVSGVYPPARHLQKRRKTLEILSADNDDNKAMKSPRHEQAWFGRGERI